MANPVVTFEMENGDIMKSGVISGDRTEHSEKFCIACKERIL